MEQVKLSTGYKSIAIRDEDDDQVVTVLRINVSDVYKRQTCQMHGARISLLISLTSSTAFPKDAMQR